MTILSRKLVIVMQANMIELVKCPSMWVLSKDRLALWLVVSLSFAVLLFAAGAQAQETNAPDGAVGTPLGETSAEGAPKEAAPSAAEQPSSAPPEASSAPGPEEAPPASGETSPAPGEASSAPAPEETTPVAEKTSPIAEEAPPVAEKTSPIAEEAPPVTEKAPPVAEEGPVAVEQPPLGDEQAPPVTVETPPVVEEAPVVIEEAPRVIEQVSSTVEETTPVAEKTLPIADETPPVAEKKTIEQTLGDASAEPGAEATQGSVEASPPPTDVPGLDRKDTVGEVAPEISIAVTSVVSATPEISTSSVQYRPPLVLRPQGSSSRGPGQMSCVGGSIAAGYAYGWFELLAASSGPDTAFAVAGSSPTAIATGAPAGDRGNGSTVENHPSAPGSGFGGGGVGGSAAGGGSGTASSASSTLVDVLLQAAPRAMRRLRLAQPSMRTSFFVLIPERPD
jgi:hypothetical protein